MAGPKEEFLEILRSKSRETQVTSHAAARSKQRHMPLSVFENDIYKSEPAVVIEKESETAGFRKFDLYYHQTQDYFHRYVVVLNDYIRLITLMRVSKAKQYLFRSKQVA